MTATNPANYAVPLRAGGGDLTITTADLNNGTNVVLTTSARMVDNYRLTVRNITDLAAAANPINPNPTLWDLPSEVILVDHAAFGEWRYDDTIATAPPVDWGTPAFDATSWKTGLPLFYGKRGTPGNTSIPTLTTLNISNALNTAQLTSVYFRDVSLAYQIRPEEW